MTERTFEVAQLGRTVKFVMDLYPAQHPDRFLLDHFEKGICYEAETVWLMLRVLREGDTMIDVGANIGFLTMAAAQLVGPSGKVIAVEPGSNNLPTLYRHLALNKAKNVEVIPHPLWNCKGPLTFYLNADDRSSNSVFDPAQWDWCPKSKVMPQALALEATTLDAIAPRNTRFIKIDVEGAEQRVLQGGVASLMRSSRPPFIVAELNPLGMRQLETSAETLRSYMARFGYQMFFLRADGGIPAMVPERTKIIYQDGMIVMNVLFSTLDAIAEAWPEAEH